MRKAFIILTALLICSAGLHTVAQEPKPTTPPVTSEAEPQKSTIDKLVDEARARGELVVKACLENCGDQTGDEVKVGRALELPKPDYPPIARAAHATGQVVVQIIIDVDGTVIAAAAVGGHPLLQGASVQAARNARFAVTKVNDQPVKVTGVITYNFVLQ
jgi:TonB family protein